ncbi:MULTISPECIES: hypothetical protein [unclassified Pseudomonas]|uniref:hypothetical protein n=1 Tax=unclassified Pseudomonas TaxID=196821 RepID=UPI0015A1F5DB|nr:MULTISPECIES: hypothetical protein [unclassified Pseudomonas]NWC96274.1 hypothetical protein [Pseudomonas sp. IPO3779]NWD15459.1 hypothetical protein [Pseudomonas sp. IPO3778]
MKIDRGSVCLQPGATSRFDAEPHEPPRAAHAAASKPSDTGWQDTPQPGVTAVRSSGYRRPLRGESHFGSSLRHLTLQNERVPRAGQANPNLQLPDSELVKALKVSFSTLKELHDK